MGGRLYSAIRHNTIANQYTRIQCSVNMGARGSVVGWGTMLQAGRSRVQVPMRSLDLSNWPNPFRRAMALISTQPLIEMNTRNILGGKGRPARKADILTAIYEPIVWIMWEPQHLTILWASTACSRDTFTLFFLSVNITFVCTGKPKHSCDALYCCDLEPNLQYVYLRIMPVRMM
jgi:hypothetical protein